MSDSHMQMEATQVKPQDLADVLAWMIGYLETIRPEMKGLVGSDMSFDGIGLDSLARVEMIAAMEKRFGIVLDPTLAYDFVTAAALSAFVWGELSGAPADQKQLMGV